MIRRRIAILISGRGSNMRALVEAARAPDFPAEVALVLSNKAEAAGLAWARDQGLPVRHVDHKAYGTREAFDAEVDAAVAAARADLIALAGFMRIQSDWFVQRWRGRQLNIHPSLLPSFKGLHPQRQALEAGVKISGCTVHFVTAELDGGPIVAQAAVPVVEGDTPESLEARILAAEHHLYPNAIGLVASGRARLDDGRVIINSAAAPPPPLLWPAPTVGQAGD